MSFNIGAYTDIGTTRETNQDSVCLMQAETAYGDVCMAIVCDGMGGLEKGEMASASVVSAFVRWFEEDFPLIIKKSYTETEILDIWKNKIIYLSNRMKEYGQEQKILLGTTFSGMLIIQDRYMWMHVGDSRIYKIQKGKTVQLTSDHTVAAREVRNGNMTVEEAMHSKLKSKLTQCVGASQILEPEMGIGNISEGDVFLLCSDGFHHKFAQNDMEEVLHSKYKNDKKIEQFCHDAVKNIMKMGEKDNISVEIIKYNRG